MSSSEETIPGEAKPANPQELRREIIEFVKLIAWFLILFFIVKTYVIEGYEVHGPSIIPTLNDRERILVLKFPHILSQLRPFSSIKALREGNIVVFDAPLEPNKRYVKRVIARGPQKPPRNTVGAEAQGREAGTVSVRVDEGAVYVNNKRLAEDYLTPDRKISNDSYAEIRLEPGTYYVMGDNRNVSKDSRSFGPVGDGRVVGKAILCFWPPSKIRLLK